MPCGVLAGKAFSLFFAREGRPFLAVSSARFGVGAGAETGTAAVEGEGAVFLICAYAEDVFD